MAPKKQAKKDKKGKKQTPTPAITGLWNAIGPIGLVAAILLAVSIFCVQWRANIAYPTLQYNVYRYYGLTSVKGSTSQTWTTLADSMCKQAALYKSASTVSFAGVIDTYFVQNMNARCTAYTQFATYGTITMYVMIGCAVLGLVSSLFIYIGGMSFKPAVIGMHGATSLACTGTFYYWAYSTDSQLTNLRKSGFYPYPSLSVMSILVIVAASLYMVNTLLGGIQLILEQQSVAEDKFSKDKEDATAALQANELFNADL